MLKQLVKMTSSLKILYVEDDVELRENTGGLFQDLFKEVICASDGIEGWEHYQKEPDSFDLVITDINMPRMNGIEMIDHITSLRKEQLVLVVSAHNESEYLINGIRSGIAGYILKPIDLTQLVETLTTVISELEKHKQSIAYTKKVEASAKELNDSNEKLKTALLIDKITGLPNQSALHEDLARMGRHNKASLMVLDIDYFSAINELVGYERANDVLKETGELLQKCIPLDTKLYRYSSDELVILDETLSEGQMVALAQQIIAFFKETVVMEEEEIFISFTIGIAAEQSVDTLLIKARTALHEVKEKGAVGSYCVYQEDSAYTKHKQYYAKILMQVRRAMNKGNVIPHYQPIVDLRTMKIVKYECLARILDEDTILTPYEFMEAIHMGGLMQNLTRMMIDKCFTYFRGKSIPFSINITMEDLLDPFFPDFLLKRAEISAIDPSFVILEVIESVMFESYDNSVEKALDALKEHGFKLAIDDFGAEQSNFNRFSKMNFDILKIDGQFIQGIDHSYRKENIVTSIVKMAEGLGLEVIAEHVSSEAEQAVVTRLGILYGQGYLLGKPTPEMLV